MIASSVENFDMKNYRSKLRSKNEIEKIHPESARGRKLALSKITFIKEVFKKM